MKGTRLGHYTIIEKLGEGGMGEVWRARDDGLKRDVAIKVLLHEVAGDPERRARFQQEARALGALNHPNVVGVYEAGEENGLAYMASELVDGESLRTVIARGRLSLRKTVDIAVQIADALAAAHAVNIIHRDLKPENVMVTKSGGVKVLDFGLAKHVGPRPNDGATVAVSQFGIVVGTVGYMSPEQVRGETLDQRSDIFSFGCVLFELATGKRAFHSATSVETMHAILHNDPMEAPPDVSQVPMPLHAIIARCLEKRPEQRFHSAADLSFALRAIPGVTSITTAQPVLVEPPARARRFPWKWAAVAAGAIAVLAVVFLLARRSPPTDPLRFQRITFRQGLVTNARFTPDARNVVYSAVWDGGPSRIYLASPGNPGSRDLEDPDGSILLSVSPKDQIAFLTGPFAMNGTGALQLSSVSGGQMRPTVHGVVSGDWAPDGTTALIRIMDEKYRLEFPEGNVVVNSGSAPLFGVRVSPDGSRVAFGQRRGNSAIALNLVDRSGKIQTLCEMPGDVPDPSDGVLSWTPDGREIWFRSFDIAEAGAIDAVDMKGHHRTVARLPGHVTLYDIARDGRLLLITDKRQLGILGAGPDDKTERDLSCLDQAMLNGISDDGRTIVATILGESGGPKGSVYVRSTSGSPPVRLGDGVAVAISPDGAWVSAYSTNAAGKRRYVLLPTGEGDEREISVPELAGINLVYGWSHDAKQLFLLSPGKQNEWRNYLLEVASRNVRPIGPAAGDDDVPMVSPDRTQVLAKGPDGTWSIYRIDGGPPRPVEGLSVHNRPIGWREDSSSLYVVTHHDVNRAIPVSIYDVKTGRMTAWKEIHPTRPVDAAVGLRITPDGKAYAFNFRIKQSDIYIASGLK